MAPTLDVPVLFVLMEPSPCQTFGADFFCQTPHYTTTLWDHGDHCSIFLIRIY